ncbi:MAG: DUF5009 domain-containing protein [Ignavibacteriaceae bacterium]|nr:DUF5009 domain-containing protein [Ignavibacteriaceae bacterium]
MEEKTSPERDIKVDIFRGLTIFLMILVNDLASVSGIPEWLKHYTPEGSGMTFVDIVFPAFLFISGMSIPLALGRRISAGAGLGDLLAGILRRGVSLLLIGVLMVNISGVNQSLTGMHKYLWGVIVLIAIIFFFNRIFAGRTRIAVQLVSAAVILFMIYIFRSGTAENPGWMQTKWWGIIGLIGWAYLCNALLYLFAKENLKLIYSGALFFLLLYFADKGGYFGAGGTADGLIWIGVQFGSHSFIMASGMAALLTEKELIKRNAEAHISYVYILMILFTFWAGWMLEPVYGINKNAATPGWSLYSVGWCLTVFALLKSIRLSGINTKLVMILSLAGSNALLVYILPDIFYFLTGLSGLTLWAQLGCGITGIIRSLVFAGVITAAAAYLFKIKFRLQV